MFPRLTDPASGGVHSSPNHAVPSSGERLGGGQPLQGCPSTRPRAQLRVPAAGQCVWWLRGCRIPCTRALVQAPTPGACVWTGVCTCPGQCKSSTRIPEAGVGGGVVTPGLVPAPVAEPRPVPSAWWALSYPTLSVPWRGVLPPVGREEWRQREVWWPRRPLLCRRAGAVCTAAVSRWFARKCVRQRLVGRPVSPPLACPLQAGLAQSSLHPSHLRSSGRASGPGSRHWFSAWRRFWLSHVGRPAVPPNIPRRPGQPRHRA